MRRTLVEGVNEHHSDTVGPQVPERVGVRATLCVDDDVRARGAHDVVKRRPPLESFVMEAGIGVHDAGEDARTWRVIPD